MYFDGAVLHGSHHITMKPKMAFPRVSITADSSDKDRNLYAGFDRLMDVQSVQFWPKLTEFV